MLYAQSIQDYLDAVASNQPTPGGGTAAAITGAQGIALLCMVCRLTLGKRRFAMHESEISIMLTALEQQRQYCLELAQKDIEVFQQVIAAYQLPKNTKTAIATRTLTIQSALKAATAIPLELLETCHRILPVAKKLQTLGNPSVISDVMVAKHLLTASLFSAKANVEINLAGITDQEFCQTKLKIMELLLSNAEISM